VDSPQLFQLCFHIAHGHIAPQIICVLGVVYFLAMTKPLDGVHPIIMGEMLYRLTSLQGDPLRGALFVLNHFRALCFITNRFPFCLFLSIIDYTDIVSPLSIILFIYEHF
jgi:hypothetical protein